MAVDEASARPLRIGWKASAEQFAPLDLAAIAGQAEEVGLDSVFVSDHAQPWRVTGGHAPSALAWLPWVAARTERITLGTSVLTPSFRYNPAVIAQTFATLALLAPGRIVFGVGTGEALNETAVGALPGGRWPPFAERFARMREAVRLIRRLWKGEEVTFSGDYYRVEGLRLFDVPDQPIPVWVAAGGPVVARYAGRMGDGMICTSGKGRELYADTLLPAAVDGAAAAARDPDAGERMIEVKLSYDRDPQIALKATRFWAPLSLPAEDKHSLGSTAEMEAAADALPIEHVARRWIVSSSPDEVVEAVREYTDLGLNHLVIHAPGHDQSRALDHFHEDVLPTLRELQPRRLS